MSIKLNQLKRLNWVWDNIYLLIMSTLNSAPSRKMIKFNGGEQSALVIQALFVYIFTASVAFTYLLIWFHKLLPQSTMLSIDLIIESYRDGVIPEPAEKFVFIILAMFVPILSFVSVAILATGKATEYFNKIIIRYNFIIFLPFVFAFMLFSPLVGSSFLATIFSGYIDARSISFCFSMALFYCIWIVSKIKLGLTLSKHSINIIVWMILISSVILNILSWRVAGINSVNEDFAWSTHADPIFYVLSEVVSGKTLLVDLPSQYGMWPEMLAPFFRITKLSVLSLTSLFAIFQLISLSALFYVFFKFVRISSLIVMGGLALIVVTFGTFILYSGGVEYYFQYWPIRFFWPAVSVLVFCWISQKKTIFRSTLMSILGSISFLWNFDSGIFVILSYGAFLVARLFVLVVHVHFFGKDNKDSWSMRHYIYAIAIHIGIPVVIIAAFFGVLILKSGELLNFSWLFKYQKIFYGLGFGMLPMPRQIHPWISILGVYLVGVLVSLNSWLQNSARKRMDTIFYLSMLGVGLFIYYQGRSHDFNLIAVCWPAVMIALILTDETIRAVRAKILQTRQIFLPIFTVGFFLTCSVTFISHGGGDANWY